ncbi:MAG TPA: folate-binding protein [Caulobacterales bacterium]|nr:folate-binding protein [Caulobacterales bacterium]
MSAPLRLDRSIIRVAGPDARPFLQGLLTQNVERLGDAPAYAGLLSPQGKVVADMILWPRSDGVLIDADAARGPDLLRRLTLYKLRSAVEIEDASAHHIVLVGDAPFTGAVADPRFPGGELGWRALVAAANAGDYRPDDGADAARRTALGVPDLARDAEPEEVFALEALFEELHGVDFHKGCFVGQENVSRMKRRATTRRKFCPIAFEGPAPPHGAPIRAGEVDLGTVRSGIEGRALALLRLDRALDADAPLSCDGRPVRLDPPPWLILPERAEETR